MLTRNVLGALVAFTFCLAAGPVIAQDHAPHWSYQGASGPARWAALEPEFGACGTGHAQSPIEIRRDLAQKAELPAIRFDYRPVPLKVIDNGHTIQVIYAPGSFIEVGGHRYELVQFHFHKPSEESIDGRRQAMVAYLVHNDAEGRIAVVAVLLNPGAINPMVASLWNNLPTRKGVELAPANVEIDASDLLPTDHAYYTFAGSLTTPPCSEGVTWLVLKTPSTLSEGQISRFSRVYPMNARPLQPLNGRVVRVSN